MIKSKNLHKTLLQLKVRLFLLRMRNSACDLGRPSLAERTKALPISLKQPFSACYYNYNFIISFSVQAGEHSAHSRAFVLNLQGERKH